MATTNNGVRNLLTDDNLPDGYTRPNVTTFTDWEYSRRLNLSITKATVENADPATTMGNIINDATVGIKKQIDDILAADYSSTATVDAYADLIELGNNLQSMRKGSSALINVAAAYTATVILYVKTV